MLFRITNQPRKMKIYLRDPTTGECHIVTINESGSEIMDAVLDQFNRKRPKIHPLPIRR